MTDPNVISHTLSVCPDCLERIPARQVLSRDEVYLEKTCDKHGFFKTRIWQGQESFSTWTRPKIPIENRFNMTAPEKGCPFDCGLCPDHGQHTCTAVLDVTQNCNFNCTFCFAASKKNTDKNNPPLDHIETLLGAVHRASPDCNLQISGGEPTLRKDLPDIVTTAKAKGFGFVQLNTNGYLLARDHTLVPRLKEAGLSSVFLQFDGLSDTVYEKLRGAPLVRTKRKAVEQCIKNRIGVILVPTLVPGINTGEIGPILEFGLEHFPGIRGVHFQPVSYFGRHPGTPKDSQRLTLSEIMDQVEVQTGKRFRQENFRPSSCEHALCSFTGKFLIRENKVPLPLSMPSAGCCTPIRAEHGSRQARNSVARHWSAPIKDLPKPVETPEDGLDRFIRQARTRLFSVSAMAFQDAWNLDLERLKGCCIHSVAPDGRLIPFCAYNLTSRHGKGLYR